MVPFPSLSVAAGPWRFDSVGRVVQHATMSHAGLPPLAEVPIVRQLLGGRRLSAVDGGARGEVFSPFDRLAPKDRLVVRFEPDPDAKLVVAEDEIVFRKALWSAPGHVKVHLTRERSCSSVYPPDHRILGGIADILGSPARAVERVLQVEADSIDHCFAKAKLAPPDFIKLDIHSAEYEALSGAEDALRSTTVGILVECWPVPIHVGQRTAADVDLLLAKAGFMPFEVAVGKWPRKPVGQQSYASKPQSVQFEILYLKDVIGLEAADCTVSSVVALIVFAELFGHTTYALQVASHFAEKGLLSPGQLGELKVEILRRHHLPVWRRLLSKAARRARDSFDRLVVPTDG